MKILSLTLLLLLSASAFALGPLPYVGVSLQGNFPTGKFSGKDIVNYEGAAKSAAGAEFDVGITGSTASLYAGYRFSKHDAKSIGPADSLGAVGKWSLNRFVLGLRWHIFGNTPSPLVPTLGAGITVGKSKAEAEISYLGQIDRQNKNSDTSVGYFIEGGALLRIPETPLSAIADIQYHSFDAKFDSQDFNGKFKIAFITAQLGVRYSFGVL